MNKRVVDTDIASMFFEEDVSFDYYIERQKFVDHMDMLSNQSVYEATLYKKWIELKQLNNTRDIVKSGLFHSTLWAPKNIYDREQTIEEINNINPKIIICDEGTAHYELWNYLRLLIHTMEFSSGIGRLIKVLVVDENTNKVLGLASLASDVISMRVRDEWIGWDDEDKFDGGRLKNTCIGSTIVATQPLGYNFLGGKLIASLLCTEDVRNAWENKFDDVLVGMTTTSLYGGHSMYQRIPYWKKLGKTTGKTFIKPDDEQFNKWAMWLKDTHPEDYERATYGKVGVAQKNNGVWEWYWDGQVHQLADTRDELVEELAKKRVSVHSDNVAFDLSGKLAHPPSGPKQNVITKIFQRVGIKSSDYVHGYKRGVYFAEFYDNTRKYLRREIPKEALVLSNKLEDDVDGVMEWWRKKAIKRYENLLDQSRIKPEHLYYRDMITMRSWDEVKEKYLNEVGR